MEIHHPNAHPLTEAEQALLDQFRQQLQERVAEGGLTGEDVRHMIGAMGGHQELGLAMIHALHEEVQTLLPGQSLLSFAWDEPK